MSREDYFNECCWGGDEVRDQLLPLISANFEGIETNQEDWGWFIWFRKGPIYLAVDIFCDDSKTGAFRVHLSSTTKKFLLGRSFVESSELEQLKDMLCHEIQNWAGGYQIRKIDL